MVISGKGVCCCWQTKWGIPRKSHILKYDSTYTSRYYREACELIVDTNSSNKCFMKTSELEIEKCYLDKDHRKSEWEKDKLIEQLLLNSPWTECRGSGSRGW